MNANREPMLAPPGAGLPKSELAIARLIFAWNRLVNDRAKVNKKFDRERLMVMRLVRRCQPEDAAKRVLIRRVRGLEDSSRYWSVWMTLDHLRIVHELIINVVGSLSKGSAPGGQVSTAAVKPSPKVDGEVVEQFEKSCDALLLTVAGVADLDTNMKFVHPWFGPLDAAGWHSLSAGHLGIHRVQIERIIEGLK